jgi:hypothetical protein
MCVQGLLDPHEEMKKYNEETKNQEENLKDPFASLTWPGFCFCFEVLAYNVAVRVLQIIGGGRKRLIQNNQTDKKKVKSPRSVKEQKGS